MNDVVLRDVWFSYSGDTVLEDVSFEIENLDFAAMVGPNGGGKTTIVKLMLGLEKPGRGTVRVFGGEPRISRRRIGYVPQYGSMDPDFPIRVRDVVAMGLIRPGDLFPFFDKKRRQAVEKALELVDITRLGERSFSELSGGEKQRCLLARALVSLPEILILDEPTASIDQRVERDIYDLLKVLNETMTIIIVTHDISFVSSYAKKIICVNIRAAAHRTGDVSPGELAGKTYTGKMSAIEHRCGI